MSPLASLETRTEELLAQQELAVYKRTDRLFALILVLQWLAGIIVAVTITPRTWAGGLSAVHIHVWLATILGAAIISRPLYLIKTQSGTSLTRHSIAIAQMLNSAFFIHLSGGRIESHFLIFGLLAFLSFYRDWRVIVSASIIATLDHIGRGFYYPESIYGVANIEPWRWMEHIWWVIFMDIFLIKCCLDNVKEMREIASRQAEIESTRDNVEAMVKARTGELSASEHRLETQYAVTSTLTSVRTLSEAAPKILKSLVARMMADKGMVAGIMWEADNQTGQLLRVSQLQFTKKHEDQTLTQREMTINEVNSLSSYGLAVKVRTAKSVIQADQVNEFSSITDSKSRINYNIGGAFALPILADDKLMGAIAFYSEQAITLSEREVSMLESIGRQIGAFAVKAQLEAENLQLVNMVQWSGDAIIGQNVDGMITSWNKGAQAFFGYTSEEIKGRHISVLSPAEQMSELEIIMAEARGGRAVDGLETVRMSKDGTLLPILLTHSPVYDDRKRIVGIADVMHNISERKDAERRVTEFYSIVSHELRTPLTSIRGVLGLLENDVVEPGSEEAANLLVIARESTDRLIKLINDMLDLKKIESGMMKFEMTCLPVDTFVRNCLTDLNDMSQGGGVTLRPSLRYPGEIFADNEKATQILTNLISNAIKFSPRGSEIRVVAEAGETGMVRFKVIDNGPGISANDQKRLFEKFQQVDTADDRMNSGTGLGLAISKAIVEEHGGKIGLESESGMGSTFWFELPSPRDDVAGMMAKIGKSINSRIVNHGDLCK